MLQAWVESTCTYTVGITLFNTDSKGIHHFLGIYRLKKL